MNKNSRSKALSVDEENNVLHVGKRLKELRKSNGFTMQQLADKSGVHKSLISRMESSKTMHNMTLLNLGNVFAALKYKITVVPDNQKLAQVKFLTKINNERRNKPSPDEIELFRTKPGKPRPAPREIKPYPDYPE